MVVNYHFIREGHLWQLSPLPGQVVTPHSIAGKVISKLNWTKILVYSSALQCKTKQSSIEKFHWSKKLRKAENFSFVLNMRVSLESVNLFLHIFLCQGHFNNVTLHKVTYNFHLKIRNILELTSCPVKLGTTCPSVIFLLATGPRLPCLKYLCC